MININFVRFIAPVFLLSSAQVIQAEETSQQNHLVITANRVQQDADEVLASIEVISRQDIDRIQPESITDLLASIAGFDFVFNGGAGQNSSLYSRGSNSDHTLVLVDGVRVSSATSGTKSFETISVAQIERIEIVKGPRASLWGSDAIGGVIQIFTRRMDSGELVAELNAGSDKLSSASLSFGVGGDKQQGGLNNTFTVGYERSDGVDVFDNGSDATPDSEPDKDGYKKLSFGVRGDVNLGNYSRLDWIAQIDRGNNEFDNDFGANESAYKNHLLNLRYTHASLNWRNQLSLMQSRDQSKLFGNGVVKGEGSVFSTRREQLSWLSRYQYSQSLRLSGGIEQYQDDVSDSKNLIASQPSLAFARQKQTTRAVFLSSAFDASKVIGEFSARYDDVEKVDSNNTFNLSVGYRVTPTITAALSRSKGFKVPTFNDLYYPDTTFFGGNSELVSEVAFNNELLLKWKNGPHSLDFSSFDNQVSNLIDFQSDENFVTRPFNVNRAKLSGQELVYRYRGEWLSHKVSASYVIALDESEDPVSGLPRNEQLLRRAKKHFNYELNFDWSEFSVYSQVSYTGERSDTDFSSWPFSRVNLKSFVQLNLGASYLLDNNWRIKLKINDLTDKSGQTILNFNPVGRQLIFGLQYTNL